MRQGPLNKGKEFRPRLHDALDKVSRVGKFLIIHLGTEKDAKYLEEQANGRGLFIRPDSKKGPVKI